VRLFNDTIRSTAPQTRVPNFCKLLLVCLAVWVTFMSSSVRTSLLAMGLSLTREVL
jgi:hypothetical protein